MKYTIYSLKTKYILKDVTAQITSYVDHPGPQLTILSKSVQQQVNVSTMEFMPYEKESL